VHAKYLRVALREKFHYPVEAATGSIIAISCDSDAGVPGVSDFG